jgi:hypothetical protein
MKSISLAVGLLFFGCLFVLIGLIDVIQFFVFGLFMVHACLGEMTKIDIGLVSKK